MWARINSTALGRARNRWASCQSPDYSQLDTARRSYSGREKIETKARTTLCHRLDVVQEAKTDSFSLTASPALAVVWAPECITAALRAKAGDPERTRTHRENMKNLKIRWGWTSFQIFFLKMLIWIRFQVSTSTQTNTSYTHTRMPWMMFLFSCRSCDVL